MIHAQVEFHNVAEMHPAEGGGWMLQRVPETVRAGLAEVGQQQMLTSAGVEIRFVTASPAVRLTLSTTETVLDLTPFWGSFQGSPQQHPAGAPVTIELAYPERLRLLRPEIAARLPFALDVWRVMLYGRITCFHGIEADAPLRPPLASEVPARRYLAYGTSITQFASASRVHLGYASQVARRLGADLVNLGSGASAFCEPAMAAHIAARTDWDFATLALRTRSGPWPASRSGLGAPMSSCPSAFPRAGRRPRPSAGSSGRWWPRLRIRMCTCSRGRSS